jgi:hypothetical protein
MVIVVEIGGMKIGTGETQVLGENLSQRHFVHHKSHMTRPGFWTQVAAVGSQRLFLLLLLVGWDFGYCGHYWPIVPAPDDRW